MEPKVPFQFSTCSPVGTCRVTNAIDGQSPCTLCTFADFNHRPSNFRLARNAFHGADSIPPRVFVQKKRRNNSGHHRLFLGGKAAQICLFLQNFRVLFWSLSTSFGGQSCEIRVPRANYFHDTSPVVRK